MLPLIALFLLSTLLISAIASSKVSVNPCPLLGPDLPAPLSPSKSQAFIAAKQSFLSSLKKQLQESGEVGENTSFSLDIYSTHEDASLLTYHHSAPGLANPNEGVAKVNSTTIYRIGSVSKLLTVYTFLIAAGDVSFNEPITKFIPELAEYDNRHAAKLQNDSMDLVDWNSITVGALASQMAGIARDFAPGADADAQLQRLGFPPTQPVNVSFCGNPHQYPCDRAAFFADLFLQSPVEAPFATPIYSNSAFQILAYALENITSTPFQKLLTDSLLSPLKLEQTSYAKPVSSAASVIPINASISWYSANMRGETPSGGIYSSIADLRAVGISILNATLLGRAQTRRWMKPVTFTADANIAVGAPWEIARAPLERVSWMYAKTGDVGLYSSVLVLLPDWDAGFTILAAGTGAEDIVDIVSQLIAGTFVPALEAAAAEQAESFYAGMYEANGSINSSMTVVANDGQPGLGVVRWINNGTDVFSIVQDIILGTNEKLSEGEAISIRLYPTGLEKSSKGGTLEAWRASYEVLPSSSTYCVTWTAIDSTTYGGVGVDEFVFGLQEDGSAVSVEAKALKSTLLKMKDAAAASPEL